MHNKTIYLRIYSDINKAKPLITFTNLIVHLPGDFSLSRFLLILEFPFPPCRGGDDTRSHCSQSQGS